MIRDWKRWNNRLVQAKRNTKWVTAIGTQA